MKIVLIHPYFTSDRDEFFQVFSEPLGLLSLATYIEHKFQEEVLVEVLDLYAMGFDNIEERSPKRVTRGLSSENEICEILRKTQADIVGIHCNFTGFAEDALEIAGFVKKALPQTVLVMGGAHASYAAGDILSGYRDVDYIVRGEGEETFYELIKLIRQRRDPGNLPGIAWRDASGRVVLAPERQLIQEIESLPILDRRHIDMPAYLRFNKISFPMAMHYPVATVMASRGCPYNCIFCSTKNMWGRAWRGRSPQNVVNEIGGLVSDYGVKEIAFYDDQFLVDKSWVHEICDLIIAKKFNISLSLPAGTSVWMADESLLRKMKRAGFYRLNLPIESGNQNALKFIRKPVDLKSVPGIIRSACRLGFWTSANFIIGFPYETKAEIMQTVKFAYNCGIDYPFFFIAKPFIGSEMYDIYVKEGLLKDPKEANSSVFVAKIGSRHLSAEELTRIRFNAERGFMKHKIKWCLNPFNLAFYVLPRVSSLKGIRYALKILLSVIRGKHKR